MRLVRQTVVFAHGEKIARSVHGGSCLDPDIRSRSVHSRATAAASPQAPSLKGRSIDPAAAASRTNPQRREIAPHDAALEIQAHPNRVPA